MVSVVEGGAQVLESRHPFLPVGHFCPALPQQFLACTRHILRRLSISTELLVLTDFGVCPLVELGGSGEWLTRR